jgi:hypothetical protein
LAALILGHASHTLGLQKSQPAEPAKKVHILLLVDTPAKLTVSYATHGRNVRSRLLGGLAVAGVLIDLAAIVDEQSLESKRLQAAVGEFDRKPVAEADFIARFRKANRYLDVTAGAWPSYGNAEKKEIDFKKALADGYPCVLAVREVFSGMATHWELSTLSAISSFKWELYDTTTGRLVDKGASTGYSVSRHPFEPAVSDRTLFLQDYPEAADANARVIYGELNRKGSLHLVAAAQGLGEEVPDLGAILERYAQRFDYSLKVPDGWQREKSKTKYSLVMEPKNQDRTRFGVNFSMDILVEEFGQNVASLDEYVPLFVERVKNEGYTVPEAQPLEKLNIPSGYTAFLVDRPNGKGREIVALRKLDGPFVAIFSVVFLEDYDRLLEKYGTDIAAIINDARITTSP